MHCGMEDGTCFGQVQSEAPRAARCKLRNAGCRNENSSSRGGKGDLGFFANNAPNEHRRCASCFVLLLECAYMALSNVLTPKRPQSHAQSRTKPLCLDIAHLKTLRPLKTPKPPKPLTKPRRPAAWALVQELGGAPRAPESAPWLYALRAHTCSEM